MVGGDQFAMALSSWSLYYQYTGDTDLIKDMTYIADTYLANSLRSVLKTQYPFLGRIRIRSQISGWELGSGLDERKEFGSCPNMSQVVAIRSRVFPN